MVESFDTDAVAVVVDDLKVVQEPELVDTGLASVLLEDVMLVEQFDNDFATAVVVVAVVLLEDVLVEQFDSGSVTAEVVGAGERLEDVQRVESFDTDSRHVAAAIVVVAEYQDGVQFAAELLDIDSEAAVAVVVVAVAAVVVAATVVEVTALVAADIVVDTAVAVDTVVIVAAA